jgi:folate-binding protein YgfZ
VTDPAFGFRLRPSAILDVLGEDRAAFLQGQLASDVRLAGEAGAIPAVGLTPKGKLLYAGRLVALPDRIRLLLPLLARDGVMAHLKKYAAFQKVSIEDRTGEIERIALFGIGRLPEIGARDWTLLSGEGEIAAEILVASPRATAAIDALTAAGGDPLSDAQAEALRIEAGRPGWGRDVNESYLPDEAGLSDAISTAKGCYVGQEIVARMRTYGRANRRLVGFRFPDGILPAGTILRRPEETEPSRVETGRVTSSSESPRFGAIGLGYAFRDVGAGDRLVASEGSPRGAVVAPIPFA